MVNTPLRHGLLQTLAYYDVFAYPLTLIEVHEKLPLRATRAEVQDCMHGLLMDGRVFHFEGFYTLRNDYGLIQKRKTANFRANEQMALARKKASFISKFPFIQGIFISGSLSKNYADEKSDLDFFIVTAPGHLWLARTIFVFVRKLLVARKHYRNYCLNYFVTSDNLRIEEQNLFTATELTTSIPVFGHKYYLQILDSNQWLRKVLPNFKIKEMDFPPDTPNTMKSLLEMLLRMLGKRTERFLMNLTLFKLTRQHSRKFSKEDFAIAFKTKEGVSKVHIGHNQKRILDLYESRVRELQPFFEVTHV